MNRLLEMILFWLVFAAIVALVTCLIVFAARGLVPLQDAL